jgi:hypothetical protein
MKTGWRGLISLTLEALRMWKSALVGAVALATTAILVAPTAGHAGDGGSLERQVARAEGLMSERQIRRFKSALRLTAEQERHWPAVASVLRTMRLGNRAMAMMANSMSLQQLVSAATPLFHSLDDGQKQVALRLVERLGFGPFVAAL